MAKQFGFQGDFSEFNQFLQGPVKILESSQILSMSREISFSLRSLASLRNLPGNPGNFYTSWRFFGNWLEFLGRVRDFYYERREWLEKIVNSGYFYVAWYKFSQDFSNSVGTRYESVSGEIFRSQSSSLSGGWIFSDFREIFRNLVSFFEVLGVARFSQFPAQCLKDWWECSFYIRRDY